MVAGLEVEKVPNPEEHIHLVLERVKPEHITKTYNVADWTEPLDFLAK